MPAESHINDGGTWRKLQGIHVNDAGTWRSVQEAYVNDGGTWRSVFLAQQITISDDTVFAFALSPGTATAAYGLEADGDIWNNVNGSISDDGDWLTPKTGMTAYEARATVTSGSLTSGTTGTWIALGGSDVGWTVVRSTNGTSSCTFTLEIRRASDGTVVDTATITLEAQRSP